MDEKVGYAKGDGPEAGFLDGRQVLRSLKHKIIYNQRLPSTCNNTKPYPHPTPNPNSHTNTNVNSYFNFGIISQTTSRPSLLDITMHVCIGFN